LSLLEPLIVKVRKSNRNIGVLYRLAILALLGLLLLGCASKNTSIQGREISVQYAKVNNIERVKMPSNAPAGAVVGGFTGLVLSSGRSGRSRLASVLGGAALGGIATKALEGERQGFEYQLHYVDGGESRFITEKDYLQQGDCVSVERGEHANVRRVPDSMCSSRLSKQPAPEHVGEARECVQAKEQLLEAKNDAETKNAARKVEILCKF